MSRFYFQVNDGRGFVDHDGVELIDEAAARAFAVRHVGEILTLGAACIVPGEEWSMDVTNEIGKSLFRLYVSLTRPLSICE